MTASLSLDSVVSKLKFVRSCCIAETRRGVSYDIMIYGDLNNTMLVCLCNFSQAGQYGYKTKVAVVCLVLRLRLAYLSRRTSLQVDALGPLLILILRSTSFP